MEESVQWTCTPSKKNGHDRLSPLWSLFLTILYVMFAEYSVKQEKERALAVVGNQTSAITNQFNVIFSRDYTLSNLMVASEGNTAYFDVVAKHLFEETERLSGIALKNIVLAPDGVVEKVYPLEGNEKLIGFNFLDPTKPGNTKALEAYEKGELVVTNPFELVQGGMGMGGRLPVYIGTGSEKTFWGLVTITLDYDEFMKAVDLESLEKSGYPVQFNLAPGFSPHHGVVQLHGRHRRLCHHPGICPYDGRHSKGKDEHQGRQR